MRKLLGVVLAVGLVACAEAPVNHLGGSRSASSEGSDEDDTPAGRGGPKAADSADDDGPTYAETVAATDTKALATSAPKPLAIDVSFSAATGQKFDANVPIHRACSDMGVDFNQASVVDGTSLSLVDVYTNKVLVKVDGAALKAIQEELVEGDGELTIPIAADALPTQPTEYAIIMGGDGRFGSPAACGVSMAPKDDQDRGVKGSAGRFPTGRAIAFDRGIGGTGCGIVGFLQAYFDAAKGEVYARPSSPIVIAADDQGRAGFPKGNMHRGCDTHSSPLVLDLGGKGVALSRARQDVFDIDGDGKRDALGWIASSDTPFLVRDANGNGIVDGAKELFGNHTDATSANGFEALSRFDDTHDGVIDAHDRVWPTLRLWSDKNHDGRTDEGELESLESRGVSSIAVGYVTTSERLFAASSLEGAIRQRGGATMTDGRVVPVLDVWFERRF